MPSRLPVVVMAGPKRALEVLPAIVVCGVTFAGVQFTSPITWVRLTDILSSLTCIAAMWLVLKFWKPATIFRVEGDKATTHKHHSGSSSGPGCPRVAGPLRPGRRRAVGGWGSKVDKRLLPDWLPRKRR
jgi:L-lactate permease